MPTFCPNPRAIDPQECIGDSLVTINEINNLLATNICNTSTMLDSLSWKVDNLQVIDTPTIDFTFTRNVATTPLGQINRLTGFVRLSSISTSHLGVDVIPAGRLLLTQAKLNNLTDVVVTSPPDGSVLKYNSSQQRWEPGTDIDVDTLRDLKDTFIPNPQHGQVLKYNSGSQRWTAQTDINFPTLVSLQDTNINTSTLPNQNEFVLAYNAGTGLWRPRVTIQSGAGISLGSNNLTVTHLPHTGDVAGTTTLTIQPCAVDSNKLRFATNETENALRAVTSNHIRTGSVIARTIGNLQVTEEKINNFAVTTNKIASTAVSTEKLADNAVTTNKINNNAVTNTKLALSPAFSVKGNSSSAQSDPVDIVAGQNSAFIKSGAGNLGFTGAGIDTALCRRSGGELGFGKITTAMIEGLPSGVPTGAVMAFAYGGNPPLPSAGGGNPPEGGAPPGGWIFCNGRLIEKVSAPNLWAVLGHRYTDQYIPAAQHASVKPNFFCVPDLRGYFIRGAGTNLDNTPSGGFGVRVADQFRSHRHSVNVRPITITTGTSRRYYNNAGADDGDRNTDLRGGSETRPKNIALNYWIKT